MSNKQTVYYTGSGAYPFGGKDYFRGDALPAGISEETIKVFMAKGKMSYTAPASSAVQTSELEALQGKIRDLTLELKNVTNSAEGAGEEIERLRGQLNTERNQVQDLQAQLSTANGTISTLNSQLDTANTTIEALTNQLTKAPAAGVAADPAAPAAAPAGAGPAAKGK